MQALLSAHPLHRPFELVSRAKTVDPIQLRNPDVMLPPRIRQPLRRLVEHLQQRVGTVALVQALRSAHPLHRPFELVSRAKTDDPIRLRNPDVTLPPRVRQPLRRPVEHLQQRIGTVALVQALLSAHPLHRPFEFLSRADTVGPCRLRSPDVTLPPRVRQPLRRLVEHLQQRIGTVALVQALRSAHLPHRPFEFLSRADTVGPIRLRSPDIFLPPRVRQPLRRLVEHLQHGIGTAALVQALLSAHCLHRTFDARSRAETVDPIRLRNPDVTLPPRVRHERHHLVESRQLGNGPTTACVHNERRPLGCRALGGLVVQGWPPERDGGGGLKQKLRARHAVSFEGDRVTPRTLRRGTTQLALRRKLSERTSHGHP